jgi:hypothetical protein
LEEAEKRTETTVAHNLELVLLVRGEVTESKSGLALNLGSMAIHEVD